MGTILNPIDRFLNNTAMYRLVLYVLRVIIFFAFVGSIVGFISFPVWTMAASLIVIVGACILTNYLCGLITKSPQNYESPYITGLILFLILFPGNSIETLSIGALTAIIAIASKFIFAIKRWHLFNPAALALVVMALFGSTLAMWWVATPFLFPFVLIGGLLIVRKIRRATLFFSFFITAAIIIVTAGLMRGEMFLPLLKTLLLSWPIVFFGTIMLTEPLTTPPTNGLRIVYGITTGLLFASAFEIGPFLSSPELALILANIYSYIVGSKQTVTLTLVSKRKLTEFVQEFLFKPHKKLSFAAGQYAEWTIFPHEKIDSRGNRRYFTIASSPSDEHVALAVRIEGENGEKGSSFKKDLVSLETGKTLTISHVAGDFTLPTSDKEQTLVFIAGGIGVTPFKSMIDFLAEKKKSGVNTNSVKEIVLLYAANTEKDFAYMEGFEKVKNEVGMKTIYIPNKKSADSVSWDGYVGYLTPEIVSKEVPNYKKATFYLSGPHAMVENYKGMIKTLGVPTNQVKTDYFPGF